MQDELSTQQIEKLKLLANLIDKGDFAVAEEITKLKEMIESLPPPPKGEDGYTPVKGVDYEDGHDYVLTEIDKKEIASKIEVPIVEKVIEKTEVIHEQPIIKEKEIIKETIKEPQIVNVEQTGEKIVEKINAQESIIKKEKVEGLVDLERNLRENVARLPNDFDVRIGVSKTQIRAIEDRVAALESGSTVSGVSSIIAGTNVTIDPVGGTGDVTINATGGSSALTVLTPTGGTPDGVEDTFAFDEKPTLIVSDGLIFQEGGGWEWDGSNVTVSNPPGFSLFGLI